MQSGYTLKGESILLVLGKLNEEYVSNALIKAPPENVQ
jgi:hypothetical protein